VRVSVVDKAISANIGALSGLDALTHLDLRNCSRIGGAPIFKLEGDSSIILRNLFCVAGDVANLTQLPVLSTLVLTGTAVHSGVDTLAAGYSFCPVVYTRCSRCEDYIFSNRTCATGRAMALGESLDTRYAAIILKMHGLNCSLLLFPVKL
jgi:hypothetical protein